VGIEVAVSTAAGQLLLEPPEQRSVRAAPLLQVDAADVVDPADLALVGDDPASATYVRMKGNACRRVGMDSRRVALPEKTSTAELLAAIDALNEDPDVRGILLQHPAEADR
jgi:methylenetetrahydrofolate dehydrogenase (NADP+)/methenyltetrahydrofolate cyclohydrolase